MCLVSDDYCFVSFARASPIMKSPIRIIIVRNRSRLYPRIPAPPIAKATSPTNRLNLLIFMLFIDRIALRPIKISPTPSAVYGPVSISYAAFVFLSSSEPILVLIHPSTSRPPACLCHTGTIKFVVRDQTHNLLAGFCLLPKLGHNKQSRFLLKL